MTCMRLSGETRSSYANWCKGEQKNCVKGKSKFIIRHTYLLAMEYDTTRITRIERFLTERTVLALSGCLEDSVAV